MELVHFLSLAVYPVKTSYSFELTQYGGRYGDELFPIVGNPVWNQQYIGVGKLLGATQPDSVVVSLLEEDGKLLRDVDFTSEGQYVQGNIVAPQQDFIIRVSARDVNNLPFVRYQKFSYQSQELQIILLTPPAIVINSTVQLYFQISNK